MLASVRWVTGALGGLVGACAVMLGGCGEVGGAEAGGKGGTPTGPAGGASRVRAVATVGMVADVVKNVGGERVEVVTLIRPGLDPHLFKPTRSDIERLMSADVVFSVGLRLEGQMGESLQRAAQAGKPVVAVGEAIDPKMLLAEDGAAYADPHVWMDPALWSATIAAVEARLSAVDSAGAATFKANAERYAAEIKALDAYAERVLGSIPKERRVLVTAHDAFGYLGRRFGVEVVGVQGISTESEASVRDIERLVDLLTTRKVGAVFVESTVSDRNMRALLAGTTARGHTVRLGGELFSDAMGAAGTYEGTYVGMIDHNVTVIARALGGEAPERGMNGRLTR